MTSPAKSSGVNLRGLVPTAAEFPAVPVSGCAGCHLCRRHRCIIYEYLCYRRVVPGRPCSTFRSSPKLPPLNLEEHRDLRVLAWPRPVTCVSKMSSSSEMPTVAFLSACSSVAGSTVERCNAVIQICRRSCIGMSPPGVLRRAGSVPSKCTSAFKSAGASRVPQSGMRTFTPSGIAFAAGTANRWWFVNLWPHDRPSGTPPNPSLRPSPSGYR